MYVHYILYAYGIYSVNIPTKWIIPDLTPLCKPTLFINPSTFEISNLWYVLQVSTRYQRFAGDRCYCSLQFATCMRT